MNELKIEFEGRPPSKKNNKVVFKNKYTGRMMVLSSKQHNKFESYALGMLQDVKNMFIGAVDVDYVFYQKGKLSQDFDNAIGTINDILQKAGIIEDDKLIVGGTFKVFRNWKEWKTKVIIKGEMI